MGMISKVAAPRNGMQAWLFSLYQMVCLESVDLTKLNESVCRECHILSSIEHLLAQIGIQNPKVFEIRCQFRVLGMGMNPEPCIPN